MFSFFNSLLDKLLIFFKHNIDLYICLIYMFKHNIETMFQNIYSDYRVDTLFLPYYGFLSLYIKKLLVNKELAYINDVFDTYLSIIIKYMFLLLITTVILLSKLIYSIKPHESS
jgi:hypothetical protein